MVRLSLRQRRAADDDVRDTRLPPAGDGGGPGARPRRGRVGGGRASLRAACRAAALRGETRRRDVPADRPRRPPGAARRGRRRPRPARPAAPLRPRAPPRPRRRPAPRLGAQEQTRMGEKLETGRNWNGYIVVPVVVVV